MQKCICFCGFISFRPFSREFDVLLQAFGVVVANLARIDVLLQVLMLMKRKNRNRTFYALLEQHSEVLY